ncbi:MAG: hypothetical protein AAF384_05025 [Pseudomonadota bacterium]
MVAHVTRIWPLLGLTAVLSIAPAVAVANPHQFGDFTISVSAPDNPDAGSYQIVVEQGGLPLTRLQADFAGEIGATFVGDLTNDGAFEVVVVFANGAQQESLFHVYSWEVFLLAPLEVAKLNETQRQGYQGNDTVSLKDGKLQRSFQLALDGPTQTRTLEYVPATGQWVDL